MDDKMNDVIDEVQKRLGEEYEVKRVEVMKNNDTKLKGIQVRRKDMNVAKICYWTSESVDEIVAVINRSLFPKFDCEINLEKLKDRIVYTLVNANSNKSRLKTIPYRMLEGTDLAITYKLIIDIDFNATASSDVTNALMEHLKVTENDLYTFATKNTQKLYAPSIKSLTDIVSKTDNQSQEDVSNTPEIILVSRCIEEFLLLVMDKEYVNCGYVKQMIKEANNENLEKADILSDNLYYYNAVNDAVSIVE